MTGVASASAAAARAPSTRRLAVARVGWSRRSGRLDAATGAEPTGSRAGRSPVCLGVSALAAEEELLAEAGPRADPGPPADPNAESVAPAPCALAIAPAGAWRAASGGGAWEGGAEPLASGENGAGTPRSPGASGESWSALPVSGAADGTLRGGGAEAGTIAAPGAARASDVTSAAVGRLDGTAEAAAARDAGGAASSASLCGGGWAAAGAAARVMGARGLRRAAGIGRLPRRRLSASDELSSDVVADTDVGPPDGAWGRCVAAPARMGGKGRFDARACGSPC